MKIVVVSGYFNPIHIGHLDYIKSASKLGDRLVVIVNNDRQVELKGSTPFMSEYDRMSIVSAIKGVHRAVLSIDADRSVVRTLGSLYDEYSVDYFFDSMVFANGGDVNNVNSREDWYCESRGIEAVYNIGGGKMQSSSSLLKASEEKGYDPHRNYEF